MFWHPTDFKWNSFMWRRWQKQSAVKWNHIMPSSFRYLQLMPQREKHQQQIWHVCTNLSLFTHFSGIRAFYFHPSCQKRTYIYLHTHTRYEPLQQICSDHRLVIRTDLLTWVKALLTSDLTKFQHILNHILATHKETSDQTFKPASWCVSCQCNYFYCN